MNYDILIKNGTIVDGTGAPGYAADIAIKDGRILEIGKPKGEAAKVIDAAGQIVSPGFIDPHTHYDPQISWDRLLESSSEHGITTVVLGNCGVGVAPCRPEHHDLLCQDLITVEGMEGDVLKAGIQWDWETFPEYLDTLEKKPLALDVGVRDGRIKPGQNVMMEGVGGGFTWGAVLARM